MTQESHYPEEIIIGKDTSTSSSLQQYLQQLGHASNLDVHRKMNRYTVKYYSAIKTTVFESVLMRWINLELIIQSEVSQKEKDIHGI